MKKISLLFLLLIAATVKAFAAYTYTLKEFTLTTDEASPITYVMETGRNGWGNPDWLYDGTIVGIKSGLNFDSSTETTENNKFLWYFTATGDSDDSFYIHPYNANGKVLGLGTFADVANTNKGAITIVDKDAENALKFTIKTEGNYPCFTTTYNTETYYLNEGGLGTNAYIEKGLTWFGSCQFAFEQKNVYDNSLEELTILFNTLDYQMAYKCLGNLAGQFSGDGDAYKTAYEAAKAAIDDEQQDCETLLENLEMAFEALEYNPIANDKYYAFKNKQHDQYMYCSGKGQKLTVNDNYFVFKLTTVSENVSLQIYIDANGRCINGDFWANNVGFSTDTKFYQLSDAPGYYIILSNSQNIYEAATEGGTVTYLEDKSTAFTNEACHWTVEEVAPSISIGSAKYSTFYAPVAVTIPDNVSAYYVSATTTSSATLTALETTIPANTGVVLYSEAECESTPAIVNYVAPQEGNLLSGSLKTEQVTGPAYVLAKIGDAVGFYAATLTDGKFQNNAGKAYLLKSNVPSAAGARFLTFDFGTETAIESIQGAESANAVVYDLAGRRVQGAQKGLYIVNGKKVIK